MEELRHSVIRVVRTATSEVDRRLNQRYKVDLACRVTVDGRTHAGRIVDLSDAGAQVHGTPTMPEGNHGRFDIDGVGFPLPFVVRPGGDDTLHVAFVLDEVSALRFGGLPARLAQRDAA
jgi:hypothetical protein